MTATPIPRSLALTMFGDMTISKLQGKPKNRLPIATNTMSINKIEHILEAINKKLVVGERIYWICPLIEQAKISDVILRLDCGIQKTANNANNFDWIPWRGHGMTIEADSLLMDVMNRFNSVENIYKGCTGIIMVR